MSNKREILKMSALNMEHVKKIEAMSNEEIDKMWERIKLQGEQIAKGRRY